MAFSRSASQVSRGFLVFAEQYLVGGSLRCLQGASQGPRRDSFCVFLAIFDRL